MMHLWDFALKSRVSRPNHINERPVVMARFCSLDQHIPGVYNLVMRPHIPVRGHLNVKGGLEIISFGFMIAGH